MTDGLDRLWATWRSEYVNEIARHGSDSSGDGADVCVLCQVLAQLDGETAGQAIYVGSSGAVILNAYPYNNGHVLVLPFAHVPRLGDLDDEVRAELFDLAHRAILAIEIAYEPDGVNFGANLGRGAGAGIPAHVHLHALPRWNGDTNFMTPIAGTRVIPEAMEVSAAKLRQAFQGV
jgi:ATP adenylyltransferase